MPQAASIPISREPIAVPARNGASPRAMSSRHRKQAAGRDRAAHLDGAIAGGWVCSTIATASAPPAGPPVAICVAVPDSTGRIGAVPRAITSSLSINRTGVPAGGGKIGGTPASRRRPAVDGGASISAVASSASAQPTLKHALPGTTREQRGLKRARPRATGWSGTGPDRSV
jgi:hypothetical protein